ncbi:Yar1p [Lachancea thermotolerans CBS 6340]|uniref:KLTH0H03014p n=1 Tax=Lachancea thermotolerans (strain ATCC 56472 / CBS 6340 / NRRL Y-8284) TaxID=559295 RepID=C5E289_LACTC|nr:KLTH0H03014p [Lachancea thermotolerans CBS 6340]CAR30150.1 KLTH0H03014p [Lachancea thermotolerans CBS 6340]
MSLHSDPLDQEDQDAIILDARCGDLESLKDIFTNLVDPKLIVTCRDAVTQSTPLHMAAANGHKEVMQYLASLVTDGAELKKWVNSQNETGNTALHWASLNGSLECVKFLCEELGADPFIRNNFDHDAIFEAERGNKEEVENFYPQKYDVEPENDETAQAESVEIKEGTEIEQVTKEATEALRLETDKLSLSEDRGQS